MAPVLTQALEGVLFFLILNLLLSPVIHHLFFSINSKITQAIELTFKSSYFLKVIIFLFHFQEYYEIHDVNKVIDDCGSWRMANVWTVSQISDQKHFLACCRIAGKQSFRIYF